MDSKNITLRVIPEIKKNGAKEESELITLKDMPEEDRSVVKLVGNGESIVLDYVIKESKLREFRLAYNRVAQQYNERVQRFPRNIVAWAHGFKRLDYLTMGNQINQGTQEAYKPKRLFND